MKKFYDREREMNQLHDKIAAIHHCYDARDIGRLQGGLYK